MPNYTTINKSSDNFNTKLYTGNGTTNHAITGVGFQPDFNWTKARTDTDAHTLTDAVRGATKYIMSSSSDGNNTNAEFLKSFDSDGFTLGTQTNVNQSGHTNVAWNWKANGAGSANTDGTINSTVSVNTTAGFSIVKFTGSGANATVGHGLGVAPKMYMLKSLGDTSAWLVYHNSLDASSPEDYRLVLNQTTARQDNTTWNDTAPTSSVFSVGSASEVNGSGIDRIVYCFAEKTGYSKFGSYTGNGNADGTFVYTGFKPTFLMVKRTDSTSNWTIVDSIREPTNNISKYMDVNLAIAEGNYTGWSFLSNGFKFVNTDAGINANGGTFIYMAFGQSLVGSNNVPCTAR